MAEKSKVSRYKYKAEMKQLLHLIVHSLYTHPEVFLRELISNASDALNKVRFRMLTDRDVVSPDAELQVKIELDKDNQTFSIEDAGVGMTKDDLVKRIGSVASSGTMQFIEQMQKEDKEFDASMIGQFGVGFYSAFMVTDEIVVETRHADTDSQGYRWKSKGEGTFTIEEIEKETRGTKITFKLKDDHKGFSDEWQVKNTIKKYSNFVDFPIFVGDEKINVVSALWQKSKDDQSEEELTEFYKFISTDFEPPLDHLALSIEGVVEFKALLFIPKNAPANLFMKEETDKSIHLYSNKIFIQDDCKDLLPEYLRFIKGVVDTSDLPLNVSREVTQNSPVMVKIRNVLTGKVLGWLEEMNKKEPEKFKTFYKNFGPLFITGVSSDFSNRDKVIELIRFETTKTEKDELASFKDYVGRMSEEQEEIYYLTGEAKETIQRNPNLEYFRKNEIEVLLLTEPVDVFTLPQVGEYDKKKLKSIEQADIDLKKDEKPDEEALNQDLSSSLIAVFKDALGDKVEDVVESKRLVDSAATLVVSKDGVDPQMEKMMKMMNKDYAGAKKILEINTSHPLVRNLSRLNIADSTDPVLRNCIVQLYEGASLIEGSLASPSDFVQRMTEIMEKATA